MPTTLLFLYAESPVHAGADSGVGALDLPIQRDGHTGLPVIWGQSLKGALREACSPRWSVGDPNEAFGSPPPGGGTGDGLKPGSLSIGDAELVAFPVPMLVNTFAWATSPLALGRLARKAAWSGVPVAAASPVEPDPKTALTADNTFAGEQAVGPYVVKGRFTKAAARWATWLAETALPAPDGPHGPAFAFFRRKLARDLVIVADDLLTQLSVECADVAPRVQLGATKTVQNGPFYTEYLPTESLLCAVIHSDNAEHLAELARLLDGQILRLGGDETIGKGLTWCRFVTGSTS